MSTGPQQYQPTQPNGAARRFYQTNPYYYDNVGNTLYDDTLQKWISFVKGYTYVGPMIMNTPSVLFMNSATIFGITTWDNSNVGLTQLYNLPEKRRAIQPSVFNSQTIYTFGDDVVYLAGSTLEGIFVRQNNYDTGITKFNSYWSPWANAGISASRQFVKYYVDSAAAVGATLDYMFHDNEGTLFYDEPGRSAVTGATQYTLPWNGLSSWKDIYDLNKGSTTGAFNGDAWSCAISAYHSKVYELAFTDIMTNLNPKAAVSDYNEYITDFNPGFTFAYSLAEDANYLHGRGMGGNAGSPVLYGFIRFLDEESSYRLGTNGGAVSYADPRKMFRVFDSYSTDDWSKTNETYRDRYFTRGPWCSFISCMSEMRAAKRNAPNSPLTPWIGSVNMGGDYQFAQLTNSYWWETTDGNQALPEALHNRWLRKNTTVTTGFTSYDGSTSAFRITSNTSEEKLLSYHFNGATSGITYVFSYYVNLGTGFTGFDSNIRNIKMNHFGKPKGLTYYQSLPVSIGPLYATAGISFGSSTGWTKVEFKFTLPSPDPLETNFNDTFCCSMFNSITGGNQTTFVADPQLLIESGITYSLLSPFSELNDIRYSLGPPVGFSTLQEGYNPRQAAFIGRRGGNSAYFYELVRHCCLEGTKGFGWFSPSSIVDNRITGNISVGFGPLDFGFVKQRNTLTSGFTGFIQEYQELDNVFKEIHEKIGGFTTGTIDPTRYVDWSLPYYYTGMPNTKGQTYWWRLTVKPGYTLYVNGITLPNQTDGVGLWLGTTGPTLANQNISFAQHPSQPEFNPSGLVKDIDFRTMNSLSDLLLAGCCFTRGSSASYIGPSGYVMFVGNNIPRFHYDPHTLKPRGLLQEGAKTNLLNWSESFASTGGSQNNWIDTNLSRTTGNMSPANNLTAIRFTATATNASLISSVAVGTSDQRTFSVWMRGITGNENIEYTENGGTSWNSFALKGNTWFRYVFGPKYNGITLVNHHVGFRLANTGSSVEIWGAQLETNAVPLYAYAQTPESSYIPTTSTTASRSGEATFMPGVTWIGNTYGTFLIETENYEIDRTLQNIALTKYNPTYSEEIKNLVLLYQRSSTQTVFIRNNNTITVNNFNIQHGYVHRYLVRDYSTKFAVSYSPNGIKLANNGIVRSGTWIGATGTITQNLDRIYFGIGSDLGTSKLYPGTMIRMRYWDYALSENEMRNLCLSGVTQDGWYNNGDGPPPQFTYYS